MRRKIEVSSRRVCLALAGVAALAIGGAAMADDGPQQVIIDLSGLSSWDLQGDANNTVILQGFNVGDILHSVKWDVNLTFIGVSWAEEVGISMTDAGGYDVLNAVDGTEGIFFPGVQSSDPISGGGKFNLDGHVMTTTSLAIELHEWNFDDNPNAPDANYGTGSNLRINYTPIPAPGVLALIGLAGLAAGRRRRR